MVYIPFRPVATCWFWVECRLLCIRDILNHPTHYCLVLCRALDGITGGNVSVANAYLADITDEAHRNENFGKMAISANLGFIVGPALAGLLGATALGETLPVLAALIISFIATLMIAFSLPESHPCFLNRNPETVNVRKVFGQEHGDCFELKGGEKITMRGIFRLVNIPYLMTLYFLIFLGFNLFYTAFPFHAVKSLKWSIIDTGMFFSVLSLMMVIVQGPVLESSCQKMLRWILDSCWKPNLGNQFFAADFEEQPDYLHSCGAICTGQWAHVAISVSHSLEGCR